MKSVRVAKASNKLSGKKYNLGELDCLSYLHQFYKDNGITLPGTWGDWTLSNYAERWSRGEGRGEYYNYLHSLGEEVAINFMRSGDLIILDAPDGVTPAIYLGANNALMVTTDEGAFVILLSMIRKYIIEVRRIG